MEENTRVFTTFHCNVEGVGDITITGKRVLIYTKNHETIAFEGTLEELIKKLEAK